MKDSLKLTDRVLQLTLLVLIGIAGISLVGWMLLMVLFPALAILQLLSAGIRTAFEFNQSKWHRRTFSSYWIMVGLWAVINGIIWIMNMDDAIFLSMMLLSLPLAIWYYIQLGEEKYAVSEETQQHRLAEMIK
ncbi:MAG: hypothetical protein MUC87_00330 [Bacteroidia bacterium]|jgi:hypothetical protein|nr:hypothetical protein [Bacteroidia bacterium]